MIKIAGSVHRAFQFPASLSLAFAYYRDLSYIFGFLPLISMVEDFGDDRYRMLYTSTELGAYTIRVFCDIEATANEAEGVLRIKPAKGFEPVASKTGFYSTMGMGYFANESLFYDEGEETRIEYQLALKAQIPTPRGMRLMPGRVVNQVAKRITKQRMVELADGFIAQSVAGFPEWLAEQEALGAL